jgi:hypothetical protein
MNTILRRSIPHVAGLLIMLAVSAIYFYPQLKGFRLKQSDIMQHKGMSKEIADYRELYKEEPLWSGTAFSGMPAYQVSLQDHNFMSTLDDMLMKIIPMPIGLLFLLMAGFYILLLCFDVNPWVATAGAVAFGLTSINILFMATGHNSKVQAIALMAPLVGSMVYAYRKNFIAGAALVALFTCLHVSANHLQMTYYLVFLLAAIALVEFFIYFRQKNLLKFFKVSALVLFAAILGVLPFMPTLLVTAEYSKVTTRGESELTIAAPGSYDHKKGLDKDYIKQYSFGHGEVWSVAIPNVKGGESGYLGSNKEAMKKVKPEYREVISQQSSYWGEQLFTGGAFYFGAGVFLLAVLGMFFIKDTIKWALLAATLLSIMLSWKYGSLLDVFIDHVPMFNKFRDTKMMLVLAQISIPLLAFLFIDYAIKNPVDKKRFLYVLLGTVGLFFLFCIMPTVWFDFMGKEEAAAFNQQLDSYGNNAQAITQLEDIRNEIINARISIFRSDCMRSILVIALTGVVAYLLVLRKLKSYGFIAIAGIISLIDLWSVDKRYMNNDKDGRGYAHWQDEKSSKYPITAQTADREILNYELSAQPLIRQRIDKAISEVSSSGNFKGADLQAEQEKVSFRELNFSTNYRVLYLPDPFNNSSTSYFHKSIGGYHGAKLKKYQELFDFYISPEQTKLRNFLSSQITREQMDSFLRDSIPVLNMLNTKYIIYNPSATPLTNPHHYGYAWFVNKIQFTENADEEMLALGKIDKSSVVMNKQYNGKATAAAQIDSSATIQMTEYKPNHLVYETSAASAQFAVFSEIYYAKGWNAYIDGKPSEHFRVNYTLRGMNIPAGKHKVEFKFEPETYYTGVKISTIGSVLMALFIIAALFYDYRIKKKTIAAQYS